jgi:hypothetical protein
MISTRRASIVAAGALALAVLASGLASADAPSRLVGTVTDFHGKYGLVVRDARGRVVDVALHPGTIIKPEGLRLERGMQVTIIGQAADRAFAAGEIDTAYQLPPQRGSKGPTFGAVPNDAPAGQHPGSSINDGRFDNLPGDKNAPRVPDPQR